MIVVTVQLVLDCEPEQAADAVNEILREQQRTFSPHSCLMDYATCGNAVRIPNDPETYDEGDAFTGI